MGYSKFIILFLLSYTCAENIEELYSIGKINELFAANVYQKLAVKEENLLMSPLSIQTILALTQTGATGVTLNEMAKVLELPQNTTILKNIFVNLRNRLRSSIVNVISANKIYVRDDIKISKIFEQNAEEFGAELESIDVIDKVKTATNINNWVEKITNEKIKDLVTSSDITDNTAMLLLNALYFKGNWEYGFDKQFTSKSKFYNIRNQTVPVDIMYTLAYCNVAEDAELNATFLEMPYNDEDFALTVVLPNEVDGLYNLIKNIHNVLAVRNMSEIEMEVHIPKFRIESTISYKDVLENMGMIHAFENATFDDITENKEPLVISKILQKTFIDVNEEGTEAAAASYVLLVDRILSVPKRFIADHPFLFFIRQKSTGAILFLGHFMGV